MPEMQPAFTRSLSVQTAEQFLSKKDYLGSFSALRIAIVGGGDTAATVAEILVGQGISVPRGLPETIDWYGDRG